MEQEREEGFVSLDILLNLSLVVRGWCMNRAHGVYTCHSLSQASENNGLGEVVGVVLDKRVLVFEAARKNI